MFADVLHYHAYIITNIYFCSIIYLTCSCNSKKVCKVSVSKLVFVGAWKNNQYFLLNLLSLILPLQWFKSQNISRWYIFILKFNIFQASEHVIENRIVFELVLISLFMFTFSKQDKYLLVKAWFILILTLSM